MSGCYFPTLIPEHYGDVMVGVFNGETYNRAEINDQKALQFRATVRPLPGSGFKRGLRLSVFYYGDHYVEDAERTLLRFLVSFDHKYLNAASCILMPRTRRSAKPPRRWQGLFDLGHAAHDVGLEALLRYDHLEPNRRNDSTKERWIAGIAYWPKVTFATVTLRSSSTGNRCLITTSRRRGRRRADRGAHAGDFPERSEQTSMRRPRMQFGSEHAKPHAPRRRCRRGRDARRRR